jgi:hypothetical protein
MTRNAILSTVIEQAIALSVPPGNVGRKPVAGGVSPFFWYAAANPASWSYGELAHGLLQVPELVQAFAERMFAACWL